MPYLERPHIDVERILTKPVVPAPVEYLPTAIIGKLNEVHSHSTGTTGQELGAGLGFEVGDDLANIVVTFIITYKGSSVESTSFTFPATISSTDLKAKLEAVLPNVYVYIITKDSAEYIYVLGDSTVETITLSGESNDLLAIDPIVFNAGTYDNTERYFDLHNITTPHDVAFKDLDWDASDIEIWANVGSQSKIDVTDYFTSKRKVIYGSYNYLNNGKQHLPETKITGSTTTTEFSKNNLYKNITLKADAVNEHQYVSDYTNATADVTFASSDPVELVLTDANNNVTSRARLALTYEAAKKYSEVDLHILPASSVKTLVQSKGAVLDVTVTVIAGTTTITDCVTAIKAVTDGDIDPIFTQIGDTEGTTGTFSADIKLKFTAKQVKGKFTATNYEGAAANDKVVNIKSGATAGYSYSTSLGTMDITLGVTQASGNIGSTGAKFIASDYFIGKKGNGIIINFVAGVSDGVTVTIGTDGVYTINITYVSGTTDYSTLKSTYDADSLAVSIATLDIETLTTETLSSPISTITLAGGAGPFTVKELKDALDVDSNGSIVTLDASDDTDCFTLKDISNYETLSADNTLAGGKDPLDFTPTYNTGDAASVLLGSVAASTKDLGNTTPFTLYLMYKGRVYDLEFTPVATVVNSVTYYYVDLSEVQSAIDNKVSGLAIIDSAGNLVLQSDDPGLDGTFGLWGDGSDNADAYIEALFPEAVYGDEPFRIFCNSWGRVSAGDIIKVTNSNGVTYEGHITGVGGIKLRKWDTTDSKITFINFDSKLVVYGIPKADFSNWKIERISTPEDIVTSNYLYLKPVALTDAKGLPVGATKLGSNSILVDFEYVVTRKDVTSLTIDSDDTLDKISPFTVDNPVGLAAYFAWNSSRAQVMVSGVTETSTLQPEGTTTAFSEATKLMLSQGAFCIVPLTTDSEILQTLKARIDTFNDTTVGIGDSKEALLLIAPATPTEKQPTVLVSNIKPDIFADTTISFSVSTFDVSTIDSSDVTNGKVYITVKGYYKPWMVKSVETAFNQLTIQTTTPGNPDGFYTYTTLPDDIDTVSIYVRGDTLTSAIELKQAVVADLAKYSSINVRYIGPDTITILFGGTEQKMPAYYAAAITGGMIQTTLVSQPLNGAVIDFLTGISWGDLKLNDNMLGEMAYYGASIMVQDVPNGPVKFRNFISTIGAGAPIANREHSVLMADQYARRLLRETLANTVGPHSNASAQMAVISAIMQGNIMSLINNMVWQKATFNGVSMDPANSTRYIVEINRTAYMPLISGDVKIYV